MKAEQSMPSGGLRMRGMRKQSTAGYPLVSIITVVLNGDKFLEQTIQSVLHQGYGNIEYIIVDGGSTDRTLNIIEKYAEKIDYWFSEPDKGIYDAMNKGIALADGELIGLINADDYYEPDAVAAVAEKFKLNPGKQILYGNTYVLQENLNLRYKAYAHTKCRLGMGICHPAMFVQRDIYTINGNYDLAYRLAADFDFMVRAVLQGVPFVPVDKFLVNYRTSGFSAVNFLSTLKENRVIIKKHFGFFSLDHFIYLGFCLKSTTLLLLQTIIKVLFGEKQLYKARRWYVRKFFARGNEVVE